MISLKEKADALVFTVHVQPRASKTAVIGHHDDALKIKLTAPPAGGAANRQCIQVLAETLGLAKSAITITGGTSHRKKRIRIQPASRSFAPSELAALKKKLIALAQKSS